MIKITCFSCKFWQEQSTSTDLGACRRYAPRVEVTTPRTKSEHLEVQWPLTGPKDWCGEHDHRTETLA
jgi:hypothetical protein